MKNTKDRRYFPSKSLLQLESSYVLLSLYRCVLFKRSQCDLFSVISDSTSLVLSPGFIRVRIPKLRREPCQHCTKQQGVNPRKWSNDLIKHQTHPQIMLRIIACRWIMLHVDLLDTIPMNGDRVLIWDSIAESCHGSQLARLHRLAITQVLR